MNQLGTMLDLALQMEPHLADLTDKQKSHLKRWLQKSAVDIHSGKYRDIRYEPDNQAIAYTTWMYDKPIIESYFTL